LRIRMLIKFFVGGGGEKGARKGEKAANVWSGEEVHKKREKGGA